MELRPYQIQSVEQLRNSMKKHKHVVLCLPTGSGKSVIFSELVRLTALKGRRVLVLTHRIELFRSTFSHLETKGVIPEVIVPKAPNPNPFSLVIVAMVETLQKRINKALDLFPDMIIIDEAHFGNFSKIINRFPDSFIVGVTATPIGNHFHKYYTDIVANIDIPELVLGKYLVPCKAYQMEDDFSDVTINTMGEFDNDSLYTHFDKPKLYDGVVREYKKLIPDKKTLVFNVNIDHTINMCEAFNNAGIHSMYVTSKTPMKERIRILSLFKAGAFSVLNNCGILTTGYDEPSIEAIIMNRATMSLPLWLQCQGRGSRTFENKSHFTVLDFGLNHDRHGMWDAQRIWSLAPPRKKKKTDAHPVKSCPNCRAVLPLSSRECSYCGFKFPVTTQEDKLERGIAVLQQSSLLSGHKHRLSELSIEQLIGIQMQKKFKPTLIHRVVRSRGIGALKEYASLMKYKKGWVWYQEKKLNDSQFKDFFV